MATHRPALIFVHIVALSVTVWGSLHTILKAMVAMLIFRKLDLPLHLYMQSLILIRPAPQFDLRQIEHQSMETARHHICIYHVILIGLGQEFNLHLHLPLQCNSELATREN